MPLESLTRKVLERLVVNHHATQQQLIQNNGLNIDDDCKGGMPPFVPSRRFEILGRVIHKRKLSKKLFFMDVCLSREIEGAGTKDVERPLETKFEPSLESEALCKVEVIGRYPWLPLADLDTLWHEKIQLGTMVRVVGDIEICSSHKTVSEAVAGSVYSPLVHLLDLDVLQVWNGADPFRPEEWAIPDTVFSVAPGPSTLSTKESQSHRKRSSEQKGAASNVVDSKRSKDTHNFDSSQTVNVKGPQQESQQQHCKFWLNTGKCSKADDCPFHHELDLAKLKLERQRIVKERTQAKRQISHSELDPHQHTTKNQHRERSLHFTEWLLEKFTKQVLNSGFGVMDIAGGRGDLSWELWVRHGVHSTVVEPRPGKGVRKWQRQWMELNKEDSESLEKRILIKQHRQEQIGQVVMNAVPAPVDLIPSYELQDTSSVLDVTRIQAMMDDRFKEMYRCILSTASVLVGLHPDQATEPIVRAALELGKPFAVIPCCVFSRDNPHRLLQLEGASTRPVTSYDDFVEWLTTLAPGIETSWINFEGMNRVVYWLGPSTPVSK